MYIHRLGLFNYSTSLGNISTKINDAAAETIVDNIVPAKKTISIIATMPTVLSNLSINRRIKSGANAYNTLDPSSGGIGSMLNIQKPRFTEIMVIKVIDQKSDHENSEPKSV